MANQDPTMPPSPQQKPIYATVPSGDARALPELPNALQQPRRRGPVKGWKNKVKPPLDEFDVSKIRDPNSTNCPGCQKPEVPVSFELTRELVRSSRDRQAETEPEQRGKAAELDLLYLAARLDGYCSLACWRRSQG